MAKKKITLDDIAAMLAKQGRVLDKHGQMIERQGQVLDKHGRMLDRHGKEIADLTASVTHIVTHMATKEDLEKLATKEQVFALQTQVNSIETELKHGRYERRLGDLEEKVFGAVRG